MLYFIVHFLTMLRKEQSIGFVEGRGSRVEGRGENVSGRGFKICREFIYLIVYYYLCFLERKRFINLSTSAPGSCKTKLGYLWRFFQRSRNLFGDGFRRLKYFREKISQ